MGRRRSSERRRARWRCQGRSIEDNVAAVPGSPPATDMPPRGARNRRDSLRTHAKQTKEALVVPDEGFSPAGSPNALRAKGLHNCDFVDITQSYSKLSPHGRELSAVRRVTETLQALGPSSRVVSPIPRPERCVRARLGQERVEGLVGAYRAGVPTMQLMDEYGLSKTAVLALLHNAGVQLRRQPLTPAQVEAAKRLYERGHSLAGIERPLGLPSESVRRALMEAGVAMRPRGGRQAASS